MNLSEDTSIMYKVIEKKDNQIMKEHLFDGELQKAIDLGFELRDKHKNTGIKVSIEFERVTGCTIIFGAPK